MFVRLCAMTFIADFSLTLVNWLSINIFHLYIYFAHTQYFFIHPIQKLDISSNTETTKQQCKVKSQKVRARKKKKNISAVQVSLSPNVAKWTQWENKVPAIMSDFDVSFAFVTSPAFDSAITLHVNLFEISLLSDSYGYLNNERNPSSNYEERRNVTANSKTLDYGLVRGFLLTHFLIRAWLCCVIWVRV